MNMNTYTEYCNIQNKDRELRILSRIELPCLVLCKSEYRVLKLKCKSIRSKKSKEKSFMKCLTSVRS